MRVLIADDGPIATMMLGVVLRSAGHEVWSVPGGAEVAEPARTFKPQLVMLDLEMPDRSGYELVNAFQIALKNAERSGKLAAAFALG